jgi:hypothetical protein
MNELQLLALYLMSEHDRRTTEENAGRMFAAMVTVFRRVRGFEREPRRCFRR